MVNGEKADTKAFDFKITLKHTDDTSHTDEIEIGGVTFTNGVGYFTLSNNETKVFDIAQDHQGGVERTVEEITKYSDADNTWSTAYQIDNGNTEEGKTASGTLKPGDSQAVTFTNTYSTPTGTLTVEKVVEGDTAQADTQLFSFKLTWKHENSGTTASAEKALDEEGDVTSGDNTISFDETRSSPSVLSWGSPELSHPLRRLPK